MRRAVEREVWELAAGLDATRRERLLNPPGAEELLGSVLGESRTAAQSGQVILAWQEADEKSSFFRLLARIPLSQCTFDQLFNGRSGYRAQFYLSPEEGVLFNRDIVNALMPVIEIAYHRRTLSVDLEDITRSLSMPHAKIWIAEEQETFQRAEEDVLNPRRWVDNQATAGRKAPLPERSAVELKGAFIRPGTSEQFIDELKLDRPCDLHRKGYS